MSECRAERGPKTDSCFSVYFSVLGKLDACGPLSSPLQDKGIDVNCVSEGSVELGEQPIKFLFLLVHFGTEDHCLFETEIMRHVVRGPHVY